MFFIWLSEIVYFASNLVLSYLLMHIGYIWGGGNFFVYSFISLLRLDMPLEQEREFKKSVQLQGNSRIGLGMGK